MYVKEIEIRKFRHLSDVRLGPLAAPKDKSDVLVLAGPNGGGKSSILELVAFALSNTWGLGWGLYRTLPDYAFHVSLGLSAFDLDLVEEWASRNPTSQPNVEGVLEHLRREKSYVRIFNVEPPAEGEQFHNQIHNVVLQALRYTYGRPMGFFLKSDRFYQAHGFQRERIFEFPSIRNRDYIWGLAFQTSDSQYRDIYEFLVQQRYHYLRSLGAYHDAVSKGRPPSSEPLEDPIAPYNDLLGKLFPGYRIADYEEGVPSDLFVELPGGTTIPFRDLSSGEKEVFFLLAFYLRHDVSHAVIVVDEPELHLHPELARVLVKTMLTVKPGNQLWLGTQNPEIIDEAGRDKVIYVARDPVTRQAKLISGTEEEDAIRALKDFFGFSGYIGIANKFVFLEGSEASSDRKLFFAASSRRRGQNQVRSSWNRKQFAADERSDHVDSS